MSGGTTSYVYRLHALSVTTGQEKFGGPVALQATSGSVAFVPIQHLQRPGLLLVNGVVYIGFGSHGDTSPWYGWLLGYSASTLKQVLAFNASPNAGDSGIWQSGAGPASDASGKHAFNTGNGGFDVNTGGIDYGDSIVKLNSSRAECRIISHLITRPRWTPRMQIWVPAGWFFFRIRPEHMHTFW